MAKAVDILIIGAGHNGLVCAGYLAKAGLDVVVLEASPRIGGACITEELVPGFRFSTFAYSAHGPGPKICRDLEVPANAFLVEPIDPGLFSPFPDDEHVLLWADAEKTAANLERFGPGEAEGYLAYLQFLKQAVAMAESWFLSPPLTHEQLYERYRGTPQATVLETLLTRSHWDVLCDYVNDEHLRCALARADDLGEPTAVGGLLAEVMEQASTGAGIDNQSGVVHGGMGKVTQALADATRRFGADIRTGCPVECIVVEQGRACGVYLASGQEMRARLVVSNADPKRTFLKLVRPEDLAPAFRRQVQNIKTRAGYMKYHAILSGVPRFTAMPAEFAGNARCVGSVRIAPTLEYYRRAWLDAQSGIPARQPVLSLQLPTAYTPEMAPAGKHIFGAWVRYAPARPRTGDWETLREATMHGIVQIIEEYAPDFRDLILWQKLYTPADIERETGITDASIRHVDMTLDQMLHRRPLPAWSAYQSPVEGLWLCGSGTHPCGSVTGGPGHNAAQAILQNLNLPCSAV
jgi:phytoene dehydrogenase-like protein